LIPGGAWPRPGRRAVLARRAPRLAPGGARLASWRRVVPGWRRRRRV